MLLDALYPRGQQVTLASKETRGSRVQVPPSPPISFYIILEKFNVQHEGGAGDGI